MAPPKKGRLPRRIFSLKPEDVASLKALAVKLGIKEAAVLRKALRELARRELP